MYCINNWIQQRKAYSNPIFGLLLIINIMIFPVYRASAAVPPVQPMAQTPEQIVDALNAVQAGATVDQAFMPQPIPYREFIRQQNDIYRTLFNQERPVQGEAYLLDVELDTNITNYIYTGHTLGGLSFELEIAQMYLPSTDITGLTNEEIVALAAVSDNSIGIVGVIRTTSSEYYFYGILSQIDNITDRLHELIVLNADTQENFNYLTNIRDTQGVDYFSNLASFPPAAPPSGGGGVIDYNSCASAANIIFNGKLLEAQLIFAYHAEVALLVIGVALALCASTLVIPLFGWLLSGNCALKALAEAAIAAAVLLIELAMNKNIALNNRTTALNLCCFYWPATCPGPPV